MVEKIIFYIIYILLYTLLSCVLFGNILSFVQISGYTAKSVFQNFINKLKSMILFLMLSFLIYFVFRFLSLSNLLMICIWLLFSYGTMLLIENISVGNKKIIKTKRLIRICVVCGLESLIVLIIFLLFGSYVDIALLLTMLPLLNCLIVFLAIHLLIPFEMIINSYYIKRAKGKLCLNKNICKVGITGSFGKTTVKEILNSILKTQYFVVSTPESYNTPLGICKTINNLMKFSDEVFVCEMGAKKNGEIRELCKMVNVDYGIVTSVGRQHTNTFKNIQGVYKTKKELPDHLHGKFCVFNLMNWYTRRMYEEYDGEKCGVYVVSRDNVLIDNCVLKSRSKYKKLMSKLSSKYFECDRNNVIYSKVVLTSEFGSVFKCKYKGLGLFQLETKLLGVHNIVNVLLAVAMAIRLGVKLENIKVSVKAINYIKARLEKFATPNGAIVINNGYNSNIDSAKSSLGILNYFNNRRKVVVTPGIIETTNDDEYNQEFGKLLARVSDEVIIVKDKNYIAITKGLMSESFDMSKVRNVKTFAEVKSYMDAVGEDHVFLIENDLPEIYR